MSGTLPRAPSDLTRVWTAAEYAAAGPRTLEDKPILGQRYIDTTLGKEYMFCKNVDTIAKVAGDVVFTSFANAVDYEIDELGGASTGAAQMKGVALGAIPASGGCGFVQTWGNHDTANVIGHASMALGASLKGSSGQSYVQFDAVVGTEPANKKHMVSRAAYTTVAAALKPVTIQCRD